MQLLDRIRSEQIRRAELARFDRWFVQTGFGPAYVDRSGRPRKVSEEERLAWRALADGRVDAMLAGAQAKILWTVAALVIVLLGGTMLCNWLGITGSLRHIAIGAATLIVEAGLIGFDIHDYFRDWRQLRDRIEAAVAGRAPLAVNPDAAPIPRNWFLLAQYAIAALILGIYLAGHLDSWILERLDLRWLMALVPLAWALHFAERRHDRKAQERMRR